MSGRFEARYGGRCGVCDGSIREGDMVRYDDDELVHDACESATHTERPVVVCATCWLTKPCECDDDT